jgi:hypothetical protein
MLLLLFLDQQDDFWTVGIAAMALYSLGLAAIVAPITATALSSAPDDLSGVASGVNQTVSRLGNLLAVAAAGFVVALVFEAAGGTGSAVPLERGQTDPGLRAASIDSFQAAIGIAAGLAFAGALVGALWISNDETRRARRERGGPVAEAAPGSRAT